MKYLISIGAAIVVLIGVTYYHHVTGNLSTTFAGFLATITFFLIFSLFKNKEKKKQMRVK